MLLSQHYCKEFIRNISCRNQKDVGMGVKLLPNKVTYKEWNVHVSKYSKYSKFAMVMTVVYKRFESVVKTHSSAHNHTCTCIKVELQYDIG